MKMPEIHFIKMAGGMLRPADQSDADAMEKVQNGSLVSGEFKQPRNAKFHRKFFAMLNFAYEYWTPEPIKLDNMTVEPEKNFERFRKDVLILAGYRHAVVNIKNEVRFEADSISFAKMDDIEFQSVYAAVFSVCWKQVLQNVQGMTQAIADNTIMSMLSFDS
jgi:hypothetical protein